MLVAVGRKLAHFVVLASWLTTIIVLHEQHHPVFPPVPVALSHIQYANTKISII